MQFLRRPLHHVVCHAELSDQEGNGGPDVRKADLVLAVYFVTLVLDWSQFLDRGFYEAVGSYDLLYSESGLGS